MTGGQARQTAGSLSREQDVADPADPADRNDAAIAGTDPRLDAVTAPVPDPEQTAEFTLAELEADEPTDPGGTGQEGTGQEGTGQEAAGQEPAEGEQLPAGSVLGKRYRLEELLAWTGPTGQTGQTRSSAATWRAFDQVLSRSVVVHLLPVGDPRSGALLAAGRRAAGATDSRFLRVLDAVEEGAVDGDGRPVGTYIVSEYAKGQPLQTVLQAAPLTGLESAWVVREVADALASAHARGLHHRRLNPETVIITPGGNVRIVGLLIEAALRPEEYDGRPRSEEELLAADVHDLGRLLYACLVARWPGGPAFGLPEAPENGGAGGDSDHPWFTPRQVRHGVSPTLDLITDQLLSPQPRGRAPRIRTATELVAELDRVLGPADATGDLERRLRHPQPSYLSEEPEPHEPGAPEPEAYAIVQRTGSIAAGTNNSDGNPVRLSPVSPASAEAVPEPPRRGPRRWVFVLVVLLLIAAIVVTVVTARGLGGTPPSVLRPGEDPTAAAPAKPEPVEIVDAKDFDPPPGNGEEHPDEVENVFDKDPETAWTTQSYYGSPKLGNLKPGVGVVLDLGEARQISEVRLQLVGDDTDLQIRVPRGDSADESADMDRLRSWRTVAQVKGAGESATATLEEKVETRYVLVFLTSLPREGGDYRGGISEAEVRS